MYDMGCLACEQSLAVTEGAEIKRCNCNIACCLLLCKQQRIVTVALALGEHFGA